MSERKEMPLSIMLENAKGMLTDAFNEVVTKTNLPAYLLEGALCDLLSDVRRQKNLELVSDYNRMNQAAEDQKKEGEE
jgi:hypothetical protein